MMFFYYIFFTVATWPLRNGNSILCVCVTHITELTIKLPGTLEYLIPISIHLVEFFPSVKL